MVGIPTQTAYAAISIKPNIVKLEPSHDNFGDAVLNSKTSKLYLLDTNTNGVGKGMLFVFNSTSGLEAISNITENAYPSKLGINEETNTIYILHSCSCPKGRSFSVVDGRTDNVVGSIDNITREIPTSIHVNPLTNKIYISDGKEVSMIDGRTNKVLKTIAFSTDANYNATLMAIDPSKNVIYGVDSSKTVVSLNADNLQIFSTGIKIGRTSFGEAIDHRPIKMIVGPNTDILFIINEAVFPPPGAEEGVQIPMADLVAVNVTSGKVISDAITELRGFYFELRANAEKNVVYAMNGNGFSVIDANSHSLKQEYYYDTNSLAFYPRVMIENSATNSLFFVAPNAIISVPEANLVPEFELPTLPIIVSFIGIVSYMTITNSRKH